MLQLTAKTQAEINKQSAASNKTPLLGGPAPYGPGIPPEVSFAGFCFFLLYFELSEVGLFWEVLAD